jgi:hypothetical protein
VIQGLEARLAELAALGQTVTYGQLARDLGLHGPATIARLTAALEDLMAVDVAQGQPLRAALVSGRLSQDLPASGFFDKAAALGLDITDPVAFVASQRAALYAKAR